MKTSSQVRGSGWFDPVYLGLAGYILLVFGPVLILTFSSVQPLFSGVGDWLSVLIPTGERLFLLIRTVGLATATALGGTTLGVLGGLFLHDKSPRLQQVSLIAFLLVGTLPPYVHALSWSHLTDQLNSLITVYGSSPVILRGWMAGVWVWMMALTPISFCLVLVGLKSIDQELVESARLLRSDLNILIKIILPLLRPYLAVSAGLLFLISLIDYSIPALFQTTSYSLGLFAEFSAHHQPWRVFLLSMPLLLIGMAVLIGLHQSIKNTSLDPLWQRRSLASSYQWPGWLIGVQTATAGILIVLVIVPIFSLLTLNSSLDATLHHIAAAGEEISFTLTTGLLAAGCSTPFGYALAQYLRTSHPGKFFPWLLVSAPVILPPTLTGIGLIAIWNHPFLGSVYNSGAMPVLAAVARFTPYASLVFLAQLRTVKPELLEAAEILQKKGWMRWIWVKLPLTAPGWIAAGLVVFIFSIGELGATLLVVPAGSSTLTIRIYNYLHYGASETVASLILIISALALLAGVMVLLIFLAWNKLLGNQRNP